MENSLRERISELDSNLIIERLSNNYYSDEGRLIAIDVLEARGSEDISKVLMEDVIENNQKNDQHLDVDKRINKIALLTLLIVLSVFISQHLNRSFESANIIKTLIITFLALIFFIPIFGALWRSDNRILKVTSVLLGSILADIIFLFVVGFMGNFYVIGWLVSLYIGVRKGKQCT
jgi:hypothetical protein